MRVFEFFKSATTQSVFIFVSMFGLSFALGTCSSPHEDSLCPLNCSGASTGAVEFKVAGTTAEQKITCAANFADNQVSTPLSNNTTLQFHVYEEVIENSGDGEVTKRVMKNAIAIRPLVNGLATIVTPKDEWCTDACGVFTIELTPSCVKDTVSNISVTAAAGAAQSDDGAGTINISVEHSSDDAS